MFIESGKQKAENDIFNRVVVAFRFLLSVLKEY
jgi:hypothetical protein